MQKNDSNPLEAISLAVAAGIAQQDECVEALVCAIKSKATYADIAKLQEKLITAHEQLTICKQVAAQYLNLAKELGLQEDGTISTRTLN